MRHDKSCEFCHETRTGQIAADYSAATSVTSRILLTTPSTVVLPTLSPIRRNHLLIIPRRHVTSTAQLTEEEKNDAQQCVIHVRRRITGSEESLFMFEHGIGRGSSGGCGVSHAHVHVVPVTNSAGQRVFDTFLEDLQPEPDTQPTATSSYIRFELHEAGHVRKLTKVGAFPSQYARNLTEAALGLSRTSWRDLVRSELLQETLRDSRWVTQ